MFGIANNVNPYQWKSYKMLWNSKLCYSCVIERNFKRLKDKSIFKLSNHSKCIPWIKNFSSIVNCLFKDPIYFIPHECLKCICKCQWTTTIMTLIQLSNTNKMYHKSMHILFSIEQLPSLISLLIINNLKHWPSHTKQKLATPNKKK